MAEFISAWGDGAGTSPAPTDVAACHCEERDSSFPRNKLRNLGGNGIATHPAGARNDGMIKSGKMEKMRLTNRIGKAFQGRSRGFTLIEVLIALALFTIIAFVFAGGLATASRAVLIADVRTRSESLARTQMESIKEQGYNSTYSKISIPGVTGASGPYYICSCSSTGSVNCTASRIIAVAWNSTTNNWTTSETGLQKITLVIKHGGTDAATSREVTRLEGYKVDRE